MSALATVARKSFNGKFTAKIDFRLGILGYHCWCWHNGSLQSLSIQYLISILTTCWWNLNKIVRSEPYKILCFLTKMVNDFWQSVDTISEDVLWLKQFIIIHRLRSRGPQGFSMHDDHQQIRQSAVLALLLHYPKQSLYIIKVWSTWSTRSPFANGRNVQSINWNSWLMLKY